MFRIVWQYYQALIEEYTLYLKSNSADRNKQKLLAYIKDEWDLFLNDFKKIEPKSVKKIGRVEKEWKQEEAIYNQEANTIVRKRIARLTILWSNPGDMITVEGGSKVILEGVDNKMRDSIYKEYEEAMELLGIKQMILQGPPGTSKTYSAKAFLKHMAHNCSDEELADLQIADYFAEDKYCAKLCKEKGDPEIAWDIVQFHPSYGYEDFVRGIKVSTKPGSDTILYETANKVLGNIAELAKKHEKTKFFLIIDEINRANLATVFGELIYGLEYRTEQVATPYSINNNNRISIPDNLYIVGTMNTADKSIGGIDYAIRRRFLFFEQLPDIKVIEEYKAEKGSQQLELNAQACKLFENIETLFEENYLSSEYRKEDVQIGHTYFLVDSKDKLMKRFEYQIIPILKEYYKDGIINFEIREKLVDTKQYKQFCKITESIILTLENLRNMDKKTNNTVKNPTLTDLLSPLEPSALESKVELMIQGGGSSEEILDVIHEYSANTEKNLSELNDRLIYYAQTASLGSVSAVIMHEIRSGMTVIKRFLNRMREMFVITDPRTKEYFEDAETSHQRLLEVANSFASLYRKNIYKEKHKTKILEAVESSVRLIKAKKEAKKIDFIIDIDENDVCTMHIGEFQTILINLLDNACYWLRNAKNKKIKISAKLSSNNKNMEIVVSDNGPGIIEEEKQKIFQPGVTAKPQGIGMGLVIVTELLNNHNCKIRLETPGEYGGATFAFEVPME